MEAKIFIFAGAGISQESGLATFRDNGGLWEQFDVNKICNFRQFLIDCDSSDGGRQQMFDFYNMRKREIINAQPNAAHFKIAEWQDRYGTDRVKIVTSNIDDLFERAGCSEVVHVHGETEHMFCASCGHTWFIGSEPFDSNATCPECGSDITKPNVVFFGESAPEYATMHDVFDYRKRKNDDMLFYVGSSMNVVHPERVFQRTWDYQPTPGFKILVDKNANELAVACPIFDLVIEDSATSAFSQFKF